MYKSFFMFTALLCTVVQGMWAQTGVNTEEALTTAVANGGSVQLTGDITLSSRLEIAKGKTVSIDLNGHTLKRTMEAAADDGNVIYVSEGATLTISDGGDGGQISGGWAKEGGAIYNAGTLNIQGGDITQNKASSQGGGIWSKGTLTLSGGTVSHNEAPSTGGIDNTGTMTMSEGTVSNNKSTTWGGGGIANHHTMTISGGTISNNRADNAEGGGLWNEGTLEMKGGKVIGNHTKTDGGGIWNTGRLKMEGNIYVQNNFKNPTIANNVFLDGESVIGVSGALTGSNIGVSIAQSGRVFTNGYASQNPSAAADASFHSDKSNYTIVERGSELAATILYNVRSWDAENKQVVTTPTPCPEYTVIEGSHSDDWIGLGDGYYVVSGNVTYKVLNILGSNVHLILPDNTSLNCAHIKLEDGHSLSIYSQSDGDKQGKLVAKNRTDSKSYAAIYQYAAAIGSGGENINSGNLYIHGGDITADNNNIDLNGAAIGSGYKGVSGGELVFYGGKVNAISGSGGSGIGSGKDAKGSSVSISIYGGDITATSKTNAGIGSHAKTNDIVTIWGGTVSATSTRAAGIGGGYAGTGGNIHIHGGTVYAKSEEGAGIGGGIGGVGGNVHIHGGTIYAKGGVKAAGIGGASGDSYTGRNVGTLEVTGGFVYASSTIIPRMNCTVPAIGSGYYGEGGNISITGGTVIAAIAKTESRKCMPIGSGYIRDDENDVIAGDSPLVVGDGMMVSYSNEDFALTKDGEEYYQAAPTGELTVANATERVSNAQLRGNTYVKIEPCQHTGTFTYTIIDKSIHNKKCDACGTEFEEEHTDDACELCGLGNQTRKVSIYVPNAEADGNYQLLKEYEVAVNKEFALPECTTVPEGYVFEGWEMNPETVGNYKAIRGNELQAPGTELALSGYSDDATFYARYLYDYIDSWTWEDDGSSFVASLKHPQTNTVISVPYKADKPDKTKITKEEEADEKGNVYGNICMGYVYWTDPESGYEYRFSSLHHAFNQLTMTDNADNATAIGQAAGKTMERVTLSGRTLYRDGSWNTLCLPFDIPRGYDPALLYNASAVKMLDSSDFESSTGTLTLNFADRGEIPAGTPFLVKWENELDDSGKPVLGDITDPYFQYVTIPESVTAGKTSTDYVDFVGTFSPVDLEGNDRKVLFMGSSNTLYYPSKNLSVNACRAYFKLNGITAGDLEANGAKAFVLNFGDEETTSINEALGVKREESAAAWYSIDGRKLNGQPSQKGLYIHNGKKFVVK